MIPRDRDYFEARYLLEDSSFCYDILVAHVI